ncbi:MAG: LacI family DNA-binding transcriptional regulator [Cyclobacteriaceae bacterium]
MHNHCITIKDIARELNLSVSTVSRAFRDAYDVSQETKEKVLTMAVQLNYKPNFNAIGLVKNQTNNIAVMLPSITNYYFSTVITGIQEVGYSKGYNIIFYVTNDSPDRELSIIKNLSLTSIDGLLVCTTLTSDHSDHFKKIIENGTPVVFFDRVATDIKTSKVVQDDYNGAFEAVTHLVSSGYEKIAHISGRKSLAITQKRTRGYVDALKKFKLPVREEWITQSGFSQEDGEKDVYELLKCKEIPDAIFAVNDRKAIGAMLSLKKLNIKIGEEMGVIGFTNDPVSSIISPGLTTIAVPALEVGSKSCELLLKHISKKHFEPEELILPGRLIVRESTLKTPHPISMLAS